MGTYRVKVGPDGVIVLPQEIREKLALVPGDTLELSIDPEGKFLVETAERSVGPLSDFFEDLILGDLRCEGCAGDILKGKLLERKLQLSTILDRLAEEARRVYQQGQSLKWREVPEMSFLNLAKASNDMFQIVLTPRVERDLRRMSEEVLREVPSLFEDMEQDPLAFKRLRGPYYETYRVSFRGPAMEHYRIIYTVFESENLVVVLGVGERSGIYERLKGIAC